MAECPVANDKQENEYKETSYKRFYENHSAGEFDCSKTS